MNVDFGGNTPEVCFFPCINLFFLSQVHVGQIYTKGIFVAQHLCVIMVFVLLRTKLIFKEYKHICLGIATCFYRCICFDLNFNFLCSFFSLHLFAVC